MAEPTTTEWFAAAAAAVLVVTLGGLHLIRPAAVPGTTVAGRLAGWLLGCLAVAALLVTAVLVGAGIRAAQIGLEDLQDGTNLPSGPFARYLFDADPGSTERVAQYGPAFLLPLAGTLAVLALAAVDLARSVGLRAVAVGMGLVLTVVSVLIGTGDVGPLAARVAGGVGLLATAAVMALAADHLVGAQGGRSSRSSGVTSSSSTTRSQRSRQSSHR